MPATAPTQIYTLSLHDALPISAGLGTGGKLPSRRSHDRGYSSGDPARRFDIDAGGAALSRPYQGVQRHMRQPAGWSARGGTDHTDQECASTQCLADFEFATKQKRKIGVRSSK